VGDIVMDHGRTDRFHRNSAALHHPGGVLRVNQPFGSDGARLIDQLRAAGVGR
jgi:hypothetical protein